MLVCCCLRINNGANLRHLVLPTHVDDDDNGGDDGLQFHQDLAYKLDMSYGLLGSLFRSGQ